MADTERRYTPHPVEVRASSGNRKQIGGYAAMFGKLSRNLGGFVEVVTPPFFNLSRADGWPDVVARWNHEDALLLGTTGGRTLQLTIDETGLNYLVDPPQARSDLVELVTRGDITKSSFAFRVNKDGEEWTTTEQGYPLRKLVSGQLIDVAPVNMPAYTDTSAGLRSLAEKMGADFEEVRKLAAEDDLQKFFHRTDNRGITKTTTRPSKPRTFGPAAAAALMARREDPYA